MTKPKSKPKAATRSIARKTSKSRAQSAHVLSKPATGPSTKHARIIAMLRTPAGTTIASLVTARNGSSIRCGAFFPVSSARNSGSTLFQSKQTRGEYIASRTEKFGLPLRTGLNRRPDAMQRKRRNGHASTKISLEHEIAYLRDLDLRSFRYTQAS